jgi:hypothetical protein
MEVLLGEAALFSHFFGAGVSDNPSVLDRIAITPIHHQ